MKHLKSYNESNDYTEEQNDAIQHIKNYQPRTFDEYEKFPKFVEYMKLRKQIISKGRIDDDDYRKLEDLSISPHKIILPTGETVDDLKAELLILNIKKDLK